MVAKSSNAKDRAKRLIDTLPDSVSWDEVLVALTRGGTDATERLEPALLAESALADWLRPEEDAAWAHLQPAR